MFAPWRERTRDQIARDGLSGAMSTAARARSPPTLAADLQDVESSLQNTAKCGSAREESLREPENFRKGARALTGVALTFDIMLDFIDFISFATTYQALLVATSNVVDPSIIAIIPHK